MTTDDLVARLRGGWNNYTINPMLKEAADEIERLQTEIERLYKVVSLWQSIAGARLDELQYLRSPKP